MAMNDNDNNATTTQTFSVNTYVMCRLVFCLLGALVAWYFKINNVRSFVDVLDRRKIDGRADWLGTWKYLLCVTCVLDGERGVVFGIVVLGDEKSINFWLEIGKISKG